MLLILILVSQIALKQIATRAEDVINVPSFYELKQRKYLLSPLCCCQLGGGKGRMTQKLNQSDFNQRRMSFHTLSILIRVRPQLASENASSLRLPALEVLTVNKLRHVCVTHIYLRASSLRQTNTLTSQRIISLHRHHGKTTQ